MQKLVEFKSPCHHCFAARDRKCVACGAIKAQTGMQLYVFTLTLFAADAKSIGLLCCLASLMLYRFSEPELIRFWERGNHWRQSAVRNEYRFGLPLSGSLNRLIGVGLNGRPDMSCAGRAPSLRSCFPCSSITVNSALPQFMNVKLASHGFCANKPGLRACGVYISSPNTVSVLSHLMHENRNDCVLQRS